ncbi:MAG: glutamate racemase [Bacilli bacterium]
MIGVFDSGIGGSTILKEIIKILPNEQYIYYSDSLNNPYGDKNKDELYIIVDDVVKYLISCGCVAIVVACNTASTICIKKLREKYPDIIFIATEPAYKMVHDYNFLGKTLVLATKGTIESEKFLALYHKYDNHNTILLPCIGLAELIEENNQDEINQYLKENLSKYKNIDNVVLGCTHYPLIKENIKNILGNVNFYDSSIGVSKQLKRKLEEKSLLTNSTFSIKFIDSKNDQIKEKRFKNILKGLL